jgi:prepilin-type N-terminal cleavage/methylation domain-containing protein
MGTTRRTPTSPRHGLTLVELLVVIGIIAGLAALLVVVFPRLQDSQRASKGADIVQGQLFIAKQMALRDQLPRGVRLISTGAQPGFFDQLQLIEQPPAYSTGVIPTSQIITTATSTWPQDPNTGWFIVPFGKDPITGALADFSGGTVKAGDYLDLGAAIDSYTVTTPPVPGAMHLIMKVQVTPPQVWVLTQPQVAYTGSPFPAYYRIIRSPRALTGEAPVALPNGIVVDAPSTSAMYASLQVKQGSLIPADTDGNFEVLFDPTGKVLRASGTQGKVVLWVKDVSGNTFDADQTLVAVYTRTGLITAQPVNLNPNINNGAPNFYYYSFVTDGATSGM